MRTELKLGDEPEGPVAEAVFIPEDLKISISSNLQKKIIETVTL